MTEIITYSLRNEHQRSDQYYRDIATFTTEVLSHIHNQAAPLTENFGAYLQENQLESVRTADEYAFELLMLGVFWRVHLPAAQRLSGLPQRILANLGRWRKQSDFFKPTIDFLRGILGTIYLTPKKSNAKIDSNPTSQNLTQLLGWLAAVGDFPEELARLQPWAAYFETLPDQERVVALQTTISLAVWFEKRSREVLGAYTPNVEAFISQENPFFRWREDVIFCARQRVEYHLFMIGTEILNRSFRTEFLATDRKVVILPPCMKAKLEAGCEAVETPLGEHCMACTPSCRVHQLTKLGEKHGFKVLVMPHELDVFSGNGMPTAPVGQIGVLGVSCPLTNAAGGWEMKKIGTPAQGILLDYCGCPWHWHADGIPTDINFNQVLEILEIETG